MFTKESTLPIFTNDKTLRQKRTEKYIAIGKELYPGVKELTDDKYYEISKKLRKKEENAKQLLMEYSVLPFIKAMARIYAKFDIEEILPFDESLSKGLEKLNKVVNKYESLPTSITEYSTSILNFYAYRIVTNCFYSLVNKNELATITMPTKSIIWYIDKMESDEFKYRNLYCEEFRQQFEKVLSKIPNMQANVIKIKFGLYNGIEMSYSEISKILNISRSRAEEIVKQALNNIRKNIGPIKKYSNCDLNV